MNEREQDAIDRFAEAIQDTIDIDWAATSAAKQLIAAGFGDVQEARRAALEEAAKKCRKIIDRARGLAAKEEHSPTGAAAHHCIADGADDCLNAIRAMIDTPAPKEYRSIEDVPSLSKVVVEHFKGAAKETDDGN